MSDREYDLKESEKGIGQLYPILEAKDGEIIDGFHRKQADKNWKRIRLEHIDTQEKKLLARLVSNFHRRVVSAEEKTEWINGLAEIYQKQGLKMGGPGKRNEIEAKIEQVTGIDRNYILRLLSENFKSEPTHIANEPRISASQRIEHQIGKQMVERHREEVKQELLKSPEFQREVIREISKPRIVKASEPCPSGVCELPRTINAGPPVDVMAESLAAFWRAHPKCTCKTCVHYSDCGVIRC